jgi:HSP20 family protein
MKMVRWDPFRTELGLDPLRALEDVSYRLNRLFDRPLWAGLPREGLAAAAWAPVVDIEETDKEYLIKAELPELKKEDVKVSIREGVLTIEGERRKEKEEKGRRFHRLERSYGRFLRSFTLPPDADEKGVRADFKDGVLSIHVGRSATARPRAIEVKVG